MDTAQEPSGSTSHQTIYEKEKSERLNLKSDIIYLVEKFEGTESIFSIKIRFEPICTKISPFRIQRAIVMLRLQYLHLFILHFLAGSRYEFYYKWKLYIEFRKRLNDLRNQITINKDILCITTLKRLIELTELMATVMMKRQTLWGIRRWGKLPDGTKVTLVDYIIQTLSKWNDAPKDELELILGIPTTKQAARTCTCGVYVENSNQSDDDDNDDNGHGGDEHGDNIHVVDVHVDADHGDDDHGGDHGDHNDGDHDDIVLYDLYDDDHDDGNDGDDDDEGIDDDDDLPD